MRIRSLFNKIRIILRYNFVFSSSCASVTAEPAKAPECRIQEHQGVEVEAKSDHQSDIEVPQKSLKVNKIENSDREQGDVYKITKSHLL